MAGERERGVNKRLFKSSDDIISCANRYMNNTSTNAANLGVVLGINTIIVHSHN